MKQKKQFIAIALITLSVGFFSTFKYYQYLQQVKLNNAIKKEALNSLDVVIEEKAPLLVKKNIFISPHFKELIRSISQVETIAEYINEDKRKYFEVQVLLPNEESMQKIAEKFDLALNSKEDLSKVEYKDKLDFFILKTKVDLKLENNQWITTESSQP